MPEFETHFGTDISGYALGAIITGFFLVMLLVALRRTGFLGRRRWILAGVLTYPLYLLHQNIGFMVFNLGYPGISPHVLVWGTLLSVLGSAYAVHVLIEKKFSLPMRNGLDALATAITDHRLVRADRPTEEAV
jgi:peptidoglycan/LPS O-acetylase OafA/YrhL